MNESRHSIDLELLSAYLDGELDETSMSRVRKQLKHDSEARSLLEQYRWQDNALRKALAESLSEPVPEELDRMIEEAPEKTVKHDAYRGRFPRMHLAAAAGIAMLTLVIGLTAGWGLRGGVYQGVYQTAVEQIAAEMFLNQATTTYLLFTSGEGWRSSDQFLRDPEQLALWFQETLERNVSIPRLDEAGYTFVGGQLLPISPGGKAGQIFYRDLEDRMVAVYVQAHRPCVDRGRTLTDYSHFGCGIGFEGRLVEREDLPVYFWESASGQTSYALLGAIEREAFSTLVDVVREQLKPRAQDGSGHSSGQYVDS